MKTKMKRFISLFLAMVLAVSMTACAGTTGESYDVPALMRSILRQVDFAEELADVGGAAALYFPDLPEDAAVEMYRGSGYFADELALITLSSEKDRTAAENAVQVHISQVRSQFASYIPEEVDKIDKAVTWSHGKYVLVCITQDYASVKLILNHGDDPNYQVPGKEEPTPESSASTDGSESSGNSESSGSGESSEQKGTSGTTNTSGTNNGGYTSGPAVRPDGYPAIWSQSGTYSHYAGTSQIRVDNSAFEICGYNDSSAANYAALVSKVADALKGKTKVYSLPIPTAFGIALPDDIQAIYPDYANQGQSIEKVLAKMSSNVIPVRIYHNLMSHRDEYIYFRTDHHWNGTGAYYAYEAFCETKGITPYTMAQRKEKQVGNFLGSLYDNSKKDQNLLPADTIYAYYPYSESATMTYYDRNGNANPWNIISNNVTYSLFAGADQPLAVFTNPEVTDGSVCVIVKESYGNALLPYLVDHYSTIYEVDYRYWKGDIAAYAQEVDADDLIFANNIMMISTPYLVGIFNTIIK